MVYWLSDKTALELREICKVGNCNKCPESYDREFCGAVNFHLYPCSWDDETCQLMEGLKASGMGIDAYLLEHPERTPTVKRLRDAYLNSFEHTLPWKD